jgi:hypothetical protein
MLGEVVLTGAKARGLLMCLNVAQGFWVPVVGLSWGFGFCLWVFVDFFFFPSVLVPFLYTSCMLRGAYVFFIILL